MRARGMKSQRGAAAVEFALVLVPLLLVVLGTIDWGWYFYVREVAANAVREGARAGAVGAPDQNRQAIARTTAAGYLTSAGLTGSASDCATIPAGSCCVRVDYATGSITGFLAAVMPANASAQATMRLEQ